MDRRARHSDTPLSPVVFSSRISLSWMAAQSMTVVPALRRSKTMKRKGKLVLSKETLRALTQEQLSEINGRAATGTVTTTLDPDCYYTVNSYYRCP
jgi:hypothetical protein